MFFAKRITGDQITQSILSSVECCSEIEQDDNGYYQYRDVKWRSPAYSTLMVALDHHTISYLKEFKGKTGLESIQNTIKEETALLLITSTHAAHSPPTVMGPNIFIVFPTLTGFL